MGEIWDLVRFSRMRRERQRVCFCVCWLLFLRGKYTCVSLYFQDGSAPELGCITLYFERINWICVNTCNMFYFSRGERVCQVVFLRGDCVCM